MPLFPHFRVLGTPIQGCRATKSLSPSLNSQLLLLLPTLFPIFSMAPQGRRITRTGTNPDACRTSPRGAGSSFGMQMELGCDGGNLGGRRDVPLVLDQADPGWNCGMGGCSCVPTPGFSVTPGLPFLISLLFLPHLQSRCLFHPKRAPHQTNPSHGCYN